LRQHRPDRQIVAEADQRLEDVVQHRVGVGVAVEAVGATDVGVHAHRERAALDRCLRQDRGCDQQRGAGQ
jgi:hypothetical protein